MASIPRWRVVGTIEEGIEGIKGIKGRCIVHIVRLVRRIVRRIVCTVCKAAKGAAALLGHVQRIITVAHSVGHRYPA